MKKLRIYKTGFNNQFENLNSLQETNLKLKKNYKITKNWGNYKIKMILIQKTTKRKDRRMNNNQNYCQIR